MQNVKSVLRILAVAVFSLFLSEPITAQIANIDSLLKIVYQRPKQDTSYVRSCVALALQYQYVSIDSMEILARKAMKTAAILHDETGIADGYKILGIANYAKANKEQALHFDSLALTKYEKLNNLKGVGSVYNNMAVLYNSFGEYEKAAFFYDKSLRIRIQINDRKGIGDSYANLANTEYALGYYQRSLRHAYASLDIRQEINNQVGVTNSYMLLGLVFLSINDLKKSEFYFRKSLALSEEIGNIAQMSTLWNNLGGLYHANHNYDSALICFQRALKIVEDIQEQEGILIFTANIAELLMLLNRYEEAEVYLKKATSLISQNPAPHLTANVFMRKAEFAAHYKDYSQAITYMKMSFANAAIIGDKRMAMEASEILSRYLEQLHQDADALKYYKLSRNYKDSLFNEENEKKLREVEYTYELTEKQKAISALQTQNLLQHKISNQQRVGLILLTVLLIALLAVAYNLYKSRRKEHQYNLLISNQKVALEKQAQELTELNEVKDKVFSILSHDLRAPVSSILGLLQLLESEAISQQEFLSFKTLMRDQMGALNLVLDNLLNWSRQQMKGRITTIPVHVNIHEVVTQQIRLYSPILQQKNICILNDLPVSLSAYADTAQTEVIIRNLISNAVKFTPAGGSIRITGTMESNRCLVEVSDTGIGMDAETLRLLFSAKSTSTRGTAGELGTGIGLRLCKEFAENNQGSITIYSEVQQGTRIQLRLPIS